MQSVVVLRAMGPPLWCAILYVSVSWYQGEMRWRSTTSCAPKSHLDQAVWNLKILPHLDLYNDMEGLKQIQSPR
jgi:hypothetical protein